MADTTTFLTDRPFTVAKVKRRESEAVTCTLRRTAGDTVWLEHMQGLLSATAFLMTRVVAAATVHRRWRTSGEKTLMSVVPFLRISP